MQIQFNERQIEALRCKSASEHRSIAALVRCAVDAWIETDMEPTFDERRRRALAAVGRYASEHHDVAERHDDYLADAFAKDFEQ
jgi:hypothetical protein